MIVLGIDPGTRRVGYGVVETYRGTATYIAAGILDIAAKDDLAAIQETRREMERVLKRHKPDVVAVEKLFFSKNRKTAMAVAQARGVLLLAAAGSGAEVREYSPNEVKIGVTGYGSADKKAVLKMVRLILKKPDLAVIDDASDALALAIVAAHEPARRAR